MHRLLTLLLLACAEKGGGDGAVDSGAPAPAACPALDVVEVAAWAEADLPTRADLRHTMQGVAIGDLDGDADLDALVSWGGGSFGLRGGQARSQVLEAARKWHDIVWRGISRYCIGGFRLDRGQFRHGAWLRLDRTSRGGWGHPPRNSRTAEPFRRPAGPNRAISR